MNTTATKRQDPNGDSRTDVSERVTHIYLRDGNALVNNRRPSIRVGQDLEINGLGSFPVLAMFREATGVRILLGNGAAAFIPNDAILLTLATAEVLPRPAA